MSDERNDYKKREELLKRMIESVVMPNYPQIKDIIISSFFFRAMRCYEVLVIIDTNDFSLEKKISEQINTLFKMASLNERHINGRDYVDVHFA